MTKLNQSALTTKLVRVATPGQWAAYHGIRRTVLFEARGRIAAYDEDHPDEQDENHHPLLFLAQGEAVGTARLDDHLDGSASVRLVAVTSERQRQGLGRALMSDVEAYARQLGIERLRAHVAQDAVGFYAKLGWSMHNEKLPNPLMMKCLVEPQ